MGCSVPSHLWKPVVLAAAIALVYAGVLTKLADFWWTDENYSHGLLIPFIIGYILWTQRETFAETAKRPEVVWGWAAIAGALVALWIGTAGAELFVQRTSLVLLLSGVILYFWGFRILRLALVPLFLLLLAIPIPAIIFNKVAFPLQLFASRCAVWAMRQFGIPVLRDGNIIELLPLNSTVTKKLEVVEACSGIRSLMTLVTLAVVFAYFTNPDRAGKSPGGGSGGAAAAGRLTTRWGFWRSLILVLAAVPIAILTNALRVSGTGVLARYYGIEVADGFFHTFSGWVVYISAFLLLFGLGWLLDRVAPGRIRKISERRGGETTAGAAAATKNGHGGASKKETTRGGAAVGGVPDAPTRVLPISGTKGS